jgi:hypothetical protein
LIALELIERPLEVRGKLRSDARRAIPMISSTRDSPASAASTLVPTFPVAPLITTLIAVWVYPAPSP